MYVDLSGVNPMSFNAYFFVIYVTADLIQNWSYGFVNPNSHVKDKPFCISC